MASPAAETASGGERISAQVGQEIKFFVDDSRPGSSGVGLATEVRLGCRDDFVCDRPKALDSRFTVAEPDQLASATARIVSVTSSGS